MTYQVFLGVVVLLIVGAMVWDQIRLRQMPAWKWPVAAALLALMEWLVWVPARL